MVVNFTKFRGPGQVLGHLVEHGGKCGLLLRLLDLGGKHRGARIELRQLLAVEGNAIFRAIQIERCLSQEVVRLAQLGV